MKIVINSETGYFGLSPEAVVRYCELKGFKVTSSLFFHGKHLIDATYYLETGAVEFEPRDIERDDETLLNVIEELGELANGTDATLKVVEIPDGIEWVIVEQENGSEYVAEKHRTWS